MTSLIQLCDLYVMFILIALFCLKITASVRSYSRFPLLIDLIMKNVVLFTSLFMQFDIL